MYELILAASQGNEQQVERLLNLNKGLTQEGIDEAFQYACAHGKLNIVNALLNHKTPKVNYQAISTNPEEWIRGKSPFLLACEYNHTDVINRLLDLDNPKINYLATNLSGQSGFSFIWKNWNEELIERLVALENPKIEFQNEKQGVFEWACSTNKVNLVRELLKDKNINPLRRDFSILYDALADNHKDVSNEIIAWAQKNGHSDFIEFVIRHHKLKTASKEGDLEEVDRILNLNQELDQRQAETAFFWACEYGHLAIVERFLKLDMPTIYHANNDQAFQAACANGHLGIVNRLLELDNPKVNYKYDNDYAFFLASTNGKLTVVNRLLQLPDINPRAGNFELNFPGLREAVTQGHDLIVEAITDWAQAHGHQAEVQAIIQAIRRRANLPADRINYEHSTHAGSIHKGASESALRLKARYGHVIEEQGLNNVLMKLIDLVSALDTNTNDPKLNFIRSAAKRYINEGTIFKKSNPRLDFDHVDKLREVASKVSIKELLAYVYLASQEEELKNEDGSISTRQQKEAQLVKGFYESLRGNNIDEDDNDNLFSRDNNICPEGCFNKAIESLAGQHPDCVLPLVTSTQAGAKFPKILQEEAIKFLLNTPDSQLKLSEIKGAKEITPIWSSIEHKIIDRFMEEFGMLYSGDPQNKAFQAMLATHEDIPVAPILAAVDLRIFVDKTIKSHLKAHPEDIERFKREGADQEIGLRTLWSEIENEFMTKFKDKMMQEHGDYFGEHKERADELNRIIKSARTIVFTDQEMKQLTKGLSSKVTKPLLMSQEASSSAASSSLNNASSSKGKDEIPEMGSVRSKIARIERNSIKQGHTRRP